MQADFLEEMRERFVAIDFSAANAELARIENELRQVADAKERANQRRNEIGQLKRDFRIDGADVATALLAGSEVTEAATAGRSLEQLSAESEALGAALRELARREYGLFDHARRIRTGCQAAVADAVAPLADALEADLRAAGEALIEAAAAVLAVRNLGGSALLAEAADAAIEGLTGSDRLLPQRDQFPLSDDMGRCLSGLTGKGAAFAFVPGPAFARRPAESSTAFMLGAARR